MTQLEIFTVVGLVLILMALVGYIGVVALRKQQLLRGAGGIPLAIRMAGDNWGLGVGRYAGDSLQWYAALSLGRKPTREFRRATLEVTGQRGRRRDEGILSADVVVLECMTDGERVSLAFSNAAVTGFLSWLEASAPRW